MATHQERIRKISDDASAAEQRLIDALNALPEEHTQVAPEGAWHAAQICSHVALTNNFITAVLRGELPISQPAPDGFVEDWGKLTIPDRITTFPQLEPAPATTREQAVAQLREAGSNFKRAFAALDEATANRCVNLPFGTINLYQLGEFCAGHSDRHLGQLTRTHQALLSN